MSQVVDHVAKALMTACYGDGYWEAQHETQRDAFREQARAALKSIEFATDNMAGYAKHRNPGVTREIAKSVWNCMINEALKGA